MSPAGDGEAAEAELGRQLATLAFSRVQLGPGVLASSVQSQIQATIWWNGLVRLGMEAPLVVVHDLGLLLSRYKEGDALRVGTPGGEGDTPALARYRGLLEAVTSVEVLAPSQGAFLRDEVVVVLLARLLEDGCRQWAAGAPPGRVVRELPLSSALYGRDVVSLARERNPEWALGFLRQLVDHQNAFLVRLEQIDLGPLRLLGFFPVGAAPLDLADLYQLVSTVGVNAIADFSLQLMPSILETKRRAAAQSFAVDGYSSIERRGRLDALLSSELAQDDDVFTQRALSSDLLYYGHERPQEGSRRVHGVLVDASASMRGAREVFARGLGLALAKKLALLGGDVWLSFFDSRLHRRLDAGALGGKELPYYLCFRSERGRNYAHVFEQVRAELGRLSARSSRELAVTFITHAECHVPTPLVAALARAAALYGIFVLPSRPLALDYLGLLRGHQVVTAESLSRPADKRRRALEIVSDVAAKAR